MQFKNMSQLAQHNNKNSLQSTLKTMNPKILCDAWKSKVEMDKIELNSTAKASRIDKG